MILRDPARCCADPSRTLPATLAESGKGAATSDSGGGRVRDLVLAPADPADPARAGCRPMMGRTHFATGAGAALAVAAVLDLPVTAVPVLAVVGAASAYGPDVDHPNATAAKCLPPFSWGVCWAVRRLSVRTVGIAHRGLPHTIAASLVWGVLVGALSAYWLVPLAAVCTAVFGTLGYLAGVLGDVPTKTSLDFLFWPFRVQVRWPSWLRFRTGGTAERWIFRGLVIAGVLLLPAAA